eukprot:EG_transcript_11351
MSDQLTGTVKSLKPNFGFVAGSDGIDYYAHKSELKGAGIVVGASVTFTPKKTEKGQNAVNVRLAGAQESTGKGKGKGKGKKGGQAQAQTAAPVETPSAATEALANAVPKEDAVQVEKKTVSAEEPSNGKLQEEVITNDIEKTSEQIPAAPEVVAQPKEAEPEPEIPAAPEVVAQPKEAEPEPEIPAAPEVVAQPKEAEPEPEIPAAPEVVAQPKEAEPEPEVAAEPVAVTPTKEGETNKEVPTEDTAVAEAKQEPVTAEGIVVEQGEVPQGNVPEAQAPEAAESHQSIVPSSPEEASVPKGVETTSTTTVQAAKPTAIEEPKANQLAQPPPEAGCCIIL